MKQLLCVVLVAFLMPFAAQAQEKNKEALALLDAVSSKYQQLSGFKANFEFSYKHPADQAASKQQGEIAVKGSKYRLKLPGQEIFNDGTTSWTYIEDGNYKEVTINDAAAAEDELTPSSIYTLYKKGYFYTLKGEEKVGDKLAQVVELTAEKRSASFRSVTLYIDKASKALLAWDIQDDQGGVFSYRFKQVESPKQFEDSYFVFDASAKGKVEIIDLR
ncbi:LolA family protein [Nitritalea halalkaliphila]|uniref:LolA family protein n=1 Tax=Nitritalea halalkaliphila TaxID=590849 RepID=UPI00058DE97A|nr:outer membrane lipoprotein carrier protein LolA [Nitritalea halalkaliphila]